MNIENLFYSVAGDNSPFPALPASDEDSIFDKFNELGISSNELMVVVEEVLINAKEHGKEPVNLYINKVLDYVYIVVSDSGMGIHNTIPENKNLKDTKDKNTSSILRLSLEEGITGTGVKGRGVGLFLLSDFCKNTDSELIIGSDSGLVYQQKDLFYTKEDRSIDIKGSIVCLKTRC
jgi:hypothetical protein